MSRQSENVPNEQSRSVLLTGSSLESGRQTRTPDDSGRPGQVGGIEEGREQAITQRQAAAELGYGEREVASVAGEAALAEVIERSCTGCAAVGRIEVEQRAVAILKQDV